MTRKVSIHLHIPHKSFIERIPPSLREDIDYLWIDMPEALSPAKCRAAIEHIQAAGGCEAVPVAGSAVGEHLLTCVTDRVAVKLENETIEYFKELEIETDIPYQSLINLFLRDCAIQKMKPSISWSS